jgi:hypothetical protein
MSKAWGEERKVYGGTHQHGGIFCSAKIVVHGGGLRRGEKRARSYQSNAMYSMAEECVHSDAKQRRSDGLRANDASNEWCGRECVCLLCWRCLGEAATKKSVRCGGGWQLLD